MFNCFFFKKFNSLRVKFLIPFRIFYKRTGCSKEFNLIQSNKLIVFISLKQIISIWHFISLLLKTFHERMKSYFSPFSRVVFMLDSCCVSILLELLFILFIPITSFKFFLFILIPLLFFMFLRCRTWCSLPGSIAL